jgi:predicted ribosomally synthesized six-cysteine peptide SCIFF
MKHIFAVNKGILPIDLEKFGCGECQASCQSACKVSCTVANQECEKIKSEKPAKNTLNP